MAVTGAPRLARYLEEAWQALRAKNWRHAIKLCESLLLDDPLQPETWRALAIARWQQGDPALALGTLERASTLGAADAALLSDLGVLRYNQKDWTGAADVFQASLWLQPGQLTPLQGLADTLLQRRRYAEARLLFEDCARLAPGRLSVMRSLALCLAEEGLLQQAAYILEDCLAQNPACDQSLLSLAGVRHRQRRLEDSLALTQAAVEINPQSFIALSRLALACWNCGDLPRAVVARERALQLPPTDRNLHSNLAWLALHDPDQSAASLLKAHRDTALAWADPATEARPFPNATDPDKCLRVGYLSGEFVHNPAACFLGCWLKHQNHTVVESFYYQARAATGEFTAQFKAAANHWREVWQLDDRQIEDLIRADEIDILVDLSGNFDGNRLGVFLRRAAPVQVAFPHYPSTTGIAEIDYVVTDIWTTPHGCENEYAEKVYRLPSGYIAYRLPIEAPPLRPLPALANGYVTFGLFQRPGKYHAGMWDAVAAILRQTPQSRLLFHFESADLDQNDLHPGASAQRERLIAPLRDRGIVPNRLLFRGARPLAEHLNVIAQADIALDSFPYNGQTTTCDCLWMGVPVVNLRGSSHVARVGQALLERAGLGHFAAYAIDEYIWLASSLALDLDRLSGLRGALRAQASERLGNARRLSREMEAGYRWMWQQWCQRQRETRS